MRWPAGKFGNSFGGWGNTQEEADENHRKHDRERGFVGSTLTAETLVAWEAQLESLKPKGRKRKLATR